MKQIMRDLKPVEGDLFVDHTGKKVLIDPLTKKGYIIKTNQVKSCSMYANRHMMSIIFAGFFGFYFNWLWALLAGLLLEITLELFYRKKFLASLEELDGYEIEGGYCKAAVLAKLGKKDNIIKVVCGLLLPVMLIIYICMMVAKTEDVFSLNNIVLFLFSIATSAYSLYIVVQSMKALKIIKNERKTKC